jgi:hypothetical protein
MMGVCRRELGTVREESDMPEDLLLGLETAAPVTGSLDNIRDLLKIARREFGWAAEGIKGTTLKFEKAWQRIVLDVSRGQTERMHALRPQLLLHFQSGLDFLKKAQATALALRRTDRADVPHGDVILAEMAGMERFKARVFDLWQTAEDLEDLAARDYPLTTADLDEIGPHRRPAPSYYADESKPF